MCNNKKTVEIRRLKVLGWLRHCSRTEISSASEIRVSLRQCKKQAKGGQIMVIQDGRRQLVMVFNYLVKNYDTLDSEALKTL